MYIENSQKILGFNRAIVLANCFLNMHTIKSKYNNELLTEIDKYCPDILKKELRVPEFYMNTVKNKLFSN